MAQHHDYCSGWVSERGSLLASTRATPSCACLLLARHSCTGAVAARKADLSGFMWRMIAQPLLHALRSSNALPPSVFASTPHPHPETPDLALDLDQDPALRLRQISLRAQKVTLPRACPNADAHGQTRPGMGGLMQQRQSWGPTVLPGSVATQARIVGRDAIHLGRVSCLVAIDLT